MVVVILWGVFCMGCESPEVKSRCDILQRCRLLWTAVMSDEVWWLDILEICGFYEQSEVFSVIHSTTSDV